MKAQLSNPPHEPVRWRATYIRKQRGVPRVFVRIVRSRFWYEARSLALRHFASMGLYLSLDELSLVLATRTR